MPKFNTIVSVIDSPRVIHLAERPIYTDAAGYRGINGYLVFMLRGRRQIRRAYFDSQLGQCAFMFCRIDGTACITSYDLDVVEVDSLALAPFDVDHFLRTGERVGDVGAKL